MFSLSEYQKCVALIIDEMHVREGLVCDKHSGAIMGFTDLGDVNNLLQQFERSLVDDAPDMQTLSLVPRLLVISCTILFGKEWCGRSDVASRLLRRQLMVPHPIVILCAFIELSSLTHHTY